MSRVYFHSPSGEAELLGSERAWLGQLTANVAISVLAPRTHWEQLQKFTRDKLPVKHDFATFQRWAGNFEMYMNIGWDEGYLTHNGEKLSEFQLTLNTALAVGSDALMLAARIHGQCEIHGYIEGPDRGWIALIIEKGLKSGVFRRELCPQNLDGTYRDPYPLGWENVIALLRARDDEPVVMSYSVCDRFPNPDCTVWQPADDTETARESWYDLPNADKWRYGMEWLRDTESRMLRLNPADWEDVRFGHELSAFDLLAHDAEDRVTRALSTE